MATRRQGLTQRRKTCGYSQEALAEQLRVDRTSVGRWERGETDPQPHVRPRLAKLLNITATELHRLLFPAPRNNQVTVTVKRPEPDHGTAHSTAQDYLDAGDLDEMIRREFMRLMTIAGAIIPASEAHAIPGSTSIPDTCGSPGEYERMNSHLWQVFSLSTSKRAIYPVVREQLNGLTESLKCASSHEKHKRLCAAAGNLFQITGEIFFDSNRYTDAAHCYSLVANASKEAEEYDLWACALTRHAFIGMYERRFMDTVPLLEAAAVISERGSSQLSTRYWVAAVQAEVFSRLGDFESCRRSLETAEQVLSLGGEIQNGGWLRFDGSRLAEERGTCYAALDRPELAEVALMEALNSPLSSRRRSSVLVDLASLGIARRDIDQVISYTHAAIDLGQRTNSGYVGRKLDDLKAQLRPLLADKRISSLSQEISTLSRTGQHS